MSKKATTRAGAPKSASTRALGRTRIDLGENARRQMCELLNARLADALDLAGQCKQAHWNVKGPNFSALHELFDMLHANVNVHVDTIAERVVALGGTAQGTVHTVAATTSLARLSDRHPLRRRPCRPHEHRFRRVRQGGPRRHRHGRRGGRRGDGGPVHGSRRADRQGPLDARRASRSLNDFRMMRQGRRSARRPFSYAAPERRMVI